MVQILIDLPKLFVQKLALLMAYHSLMVSLLQLNLLVLLLQMMEAAMLQLVLLALELHIMMVM
jgi:hypothetical protein